MKNPLETLSPTPGIDDIVQFAESHRVSLQAGKYTLTVKHQLIGDGIDQGNPWESTHNFAVLGERYHLPAQSVRAVFPPKGGEGDYWRVLPHIVLERSTLPWERTSDANKDAPPPWLALLVFREGEEKQNVANWKPDDFNWVKLPSEMRTRNDLNREKERVNVIKVGQPLLPSPNDLQRLAHVRRRLAFKEKHSTIEEAERAVPGIKYELDAEEKKALPTNATNGWIIADHTNKEKYEILEFENGTETTFHIYHIAHEAATIIANRLPQPGKNNIVHLVSMEYPRPDDLEFVSLYQWSFRCEEETKNFKGLFEALDKADWHLKVNQAATNVKSFLHNGMVPLPHFFREGSKSISWYRGPLIPMKNNANFGEVFKNRDILNKGVRHADQLLQFDLKYGVFDISYAAAWELGRMLTLQNTEIALSLFHWKNEHAHQQHSIQHLADYGYALANGLTQESTDPEEDSIKKWLGELKLLRHIPFNYLVPTEAIFPKESLRFFQIDPLWIDFLLDGAYSIGRVTTKDSESDIRLKQKLIQMDKNSYTGFLIRSEIVAGWPDLQIAAYKKEPPKDELEPYQTNPKVIQPIRKVRLAPDILMLIYQEKVVSLDFYLTPETLHFGFDLSGSSTEQGNYGDLVINLRNPDDGTSANTTIAMTNIISTEGIVDLSQLEGQLNNHNQLDPPIKSHTLALQLVAGSDLIRINTPT